MLLNQDDASVRSTPSPEVGAVCGNSARTDLSGGRPERAVPTAHTLLGLPGLLKNKAVHYNNCLCPSRLWTELSRLSRRRESRELAATDTCAVRRMLHRHCGHLRSDDRDINASSSTQGPPRPPARTSAYVPVRALGSFQFTWSDMPTYDEFEYQIADQLA